MAEPKKEKKVRKFEVVSAINLGGGDIRGAGSTVNEDELAPADLADLMKAGRLRDGDAPIPPSQAEGVVAFDRLLNVAKKIGVVRQDGGAYSLGEKKASGLSAFRALVSIDELEAAIVAAFKEK